MVAAVGSQAGSGVPAVPGGRAQRPVQRHPAHHLGVDVVPRRPPGLPDPVVGLVPAGQHGRGHLDHQLPVGVGQHALPGAEGVDQFGDRPEDVQLHLVVRGVADPDRPGARVAGQALDDGLGGQRRPGDRVQRVQPLRAGGVGQDPAQPGQEPLGLRGGAEVHQRVDRHGAVPQPAVPVVPVPGAADPLRQRGGGRGQHGAGGFVDQGPEHQGGPADQGGFHGGQLQRLHPAPGMMGDGGAARVSPPAVPPAGVPCRRSAGSAPRGRAAGRRRPWRWRAGRPR